jgi:hypothetical protein
MYWTTLLAVLYYTKNSYPNSNMNESMKDFEKKSSNIDQEVEDENVNNQDLSQNLNNCTNHTENEIQRCDTEMLDTAMECETEMEGETKKEN